MRRIVALSLAISLAGCSTGAERRAAERAATLNAAKGRSIADVSLTMGPPTSKIDTAPGRANFQWVSTSTRNTGGSAIAIPGTSIVDIDPGQQITMVCRVNFIASTTK